MKKELIIFAVGLILAPVSIVIYESLLSPDIHLKIPKDDYAYVCKGGANYSPEIIASICKKDADLILRTANSVQLSQHHHQTNAEEDQQGW